MKVFEIERTASSFYQEKLRYIKTECKSSARCFRRRGSHVKVWTRNTYIIHYQRCRIWCQVKPNPKDLRNKQLKDRCISKTVQRGLVRLKHFKELIIYESHLRERQKSRGRYSAV